MHHRVMHHRVMHLRVIFSTILTAYHDAEMINAVFYIGMLGGLLAKLARILAQLVRPF